MIRSQSSARSEQGIVRERRRGILLPAFVLGLPLAVGILVLAEQDLLGPVVKRYLVHPVEVAELVMFCCALGALVAKAWVNLRESAACRFAFLPPWDGQAVPVADAGPLLKEVERHPRNLLNSYLGCRFANVLGFVRGRGAADQLDDQLRTLADNDALAQEGSYGFIRFIAWGIPILGFLGTVLGITQAISGVTPEVLEKSLSQVTDGLATAFDTTALALALTMALMFLSFLVERAEQRVLEQVDRIAEEELAHRFERGGAEQNQVTELVRQNSQAVIQATEQLVQRQATLWAQTLEEMDKRRTDAESRHHERLTTVLEAVLDKTQQTHARRLVALEKQAVEQSASLLEQLTALAGAIRTSNGEQQSALARVAESIAGQTQVLGQLQEGEQHLLRLQEALNQNLTVLAGTGAFEQAVESLTAAIHLLTARAGQVSTSPRLHRPGEAA